MLNDEENAVLFGTSWARERAFSFFRGKFFFLTDLTGLTDLLAAINGTVDIALFALIANAFEGRDRRLKLLRVPTSRVVDV